MDKLEKREKEIIEQLNKLGVVYWEENGIPLYISSESKEALEWEN